MCGAVEAAVGAREHVIFTGYALFLQDFRQQGVAFHINVGCTGVEVDLKAGQFACLSQVNRIPPVAGLLVRIQPVRYARIGKRIREQRGAVPADTAEQLRMAKSQVQRSVSAHRMAPYHAAGPVVFLWSVESNMVLTCTAQK